MILVFDFDDTLNNLQETVIEIYNERHHTRYTLSDCIHYDMEDCFPVGMANEIKSLYADPKTYERVKPLSGAKNMLQKLVNSGHQVYIATHNWPQQFNTKAQWIKHHFPCMDEAHIIAISHKHLLRCDIMVEDKLDNLLAKPYYYRICMNRPWNQDVYDEVYGICRVNDCQEVLSAIKCIEKEESEG